MNGLERLFAQQLLSETQYFLLQRGKFTEFTWARRPLRERSRTYAHGERCHAAADGFDGLPPKHLWCRRYRACWLVGWYIRDWLMREGYIGSM